MLVPFGKVSAFFCAHGKAFVTGLALATVRHVFPAHEAPAAHATHVPSDAARHGLAHCLLRELFQVLANLLKRVSDASAA